MPAAGIRYSSTQLNYFKFISIVVDEFPKALRHAFKTMWDNKFPTQPWNDSVTVHNKLRSLEGHSSKIPIGTTYKEWDCTALFQATIFAKTFKDATGLILRDKYLLSSAPSRGSFRPTVTSSAGNQQETFALAIDQLRLLRNELSHLVSTKVINQDKFDDYIENAKMAFTALHYNLSHIDDISNLTESDFPTDKVAELEETIKVLQDERKMWYYISAVGMPIVIVLLLIILVIVIVILISLPNEKTGVKPTLKSAVPTWMNTSNPVFIGRRWLFEQLEDLFQKNDSRNGVLLVGDPGSGKTTIMKQLVNSPINSSRFIHENIIACHFCEYDIKTTHDGETFVKSLVEQLSRKISEFKESVKKKEIQIQLAKCKDDPIRCAQVTVLEPLRAMKIPLETKKFILIDALDECCENEGSYKSVILKILHGQKIRLPSWIKLLASSRNETTITGKMKEIGVETIAIRATSKDNLDDIRSFARETISQYNFTKKNGESLKEKLNESIEEILKKTNGNFLFIQKLLEDWRTDPDRINLTSIPSDMTYMYARSFRERFEEQELERFAIFFEVLLASNSPPTLQILNEIFRLKDPKYECDKVVYKLSAYLRFNNGNIRIFHYSFAEWLTNHDIPIDGFSIKMSRGHQYIADYLFDHYNQAENELTVEGLYELSMHVLNGGMLKEHVRKLKDLSNVTDKYGKCILHYLALNGKGTEVLKVFVQQFKSVDIVDYRGLTPAFYATITQNYDNLEFFITNGADVNFVGLALPYSCTIYPLFTRDVPYECYSLTFIAAHKGNKKIIDLLINNAAHINKENKCGWKPLHAAAKAGHLKIVELLINKIDRTSSDDFFALHQAVVFNHSDVLTFLLKSGVRDKCIPCKRAYKDDPMFNLNTHQYLERICGSVLNIAVSRRYLKIVKILLSYGKESLECKSLAGLTPLMRAVERDDIKMVALLLGEGADVEAQCETSNQHRYVQLIFKSKYYCSCASKTIHISAMQGTSKLTTELIERIANRFSRDCKGLSADDLATIHNQYVNTSLLNNKTMMRFLAVCGSVKTFELLSRNKSSGVLTGTIYEDGMTVLHLATLGLTNVFSSVCSVINCTAFKCPHMSAHRIYQHREEQYLKTIKLLTKLTPQNINKKDKYGRTALHYAALVRSPDVVKHLIQKGDWKIKDENGNTALKFMLKRPLDYINLGPCLTVIYSLLNSSEMAISNEMHAYCLRELRVRTLNNKCQPDSRTRRSIVQLVVHRNLPLSWYTLFKIDADLYCLSHKKSYGTVFNAMATIFELLKVVELNVKVECEVPFEYSTLHVMACTSNRFFFGNNYFPALQKYIDTYSMDSRILDESYDADGFLPIHYAVLLGNTDVVDFFMKQGVNIWKQTRSGWTTFELALMNTWLCLPPMLDKLLNHIRSNKEYKVPSGSDFWCNTTSGVSLLHLAAARGIRCLNYIHYNRFIPFSPLPLTSCNNTHGIDLLYLLKLYYEVDWNGRPANTILSKYPEREAEYHLVYHKFFVTPDVNLTLKFEVDVLDLFRHPEINNSLAHGCVIERRIKRCYNRCWHSASHASRNFLSTFRTVFIINATSDPRSDGFIDIVPHMAELRYYCVKMFYKVSTILWRQVSKAHTCSQKCRCLEIMRLLQKKFTNKPRWYGTVGRFLKERMGWNNTSLHDDIRFHWSFGFLLKKALRMDKDYDYLKILWKKV